MHGDEVVRVRLSLLTREQLLTGVMSNASNVLRFIRCPSVEETGQGCARTRRSAARSQVEAYSPSIVPVDDVQVTGRHSLHARRALTTFASSVIGHEFQLSALSLAATG